MKLKLVHKNILGIGLLLLGLFVLGLTVSYIAIPAYNELAELYQQRQRELRKIAALELFAAGHADYAAFLQAKEKELAVARQRINLPEDANQLQYRLRQQAARQRLVMRQLQVLPAEQPKQNTNSSRLRSEGMQMELEGSYFAFIRWLKQLERQQLQVQSLELHGDGSGRVKASLVVQCYYPAVRGSKKSEEQAPRSDSSI